MDILIECIISGVVLVSRCYMALTSKQKQVSLKKKKNGTEQNCIMLCIEVVEL